MEKQKIIKKLFYKIVVCGMACVLAGLLTFYGINLFVQKKTEKKIVTAEELQENPEEFDAAIILGAQVKAGGQLSLMLKERVDKGIELYEAGIVDRLLMSGDHGQDDYDEVNAMKDYAIEQGVPSEVIFMDHAGFSTYESMYRASEIFEIDQAVVVTQEYHLYRALYDAETMGIDAKGVVCDKDVYAGDKYRKFREMIARVKDFAYGIVKPEPTYLGEVISIDGNGDVTNDN